MQVPVYACLVLTTPMRAFVHDMSPGLVSLVRRFVNFLFIHLCMPNVGNTDASLRLQRVPGFGKPGATRRQHRLLPGAPLIRNHCAHDQLGVSLLPRLHSDSLDTGYPD
jgi:hypothetical protein